MKNLLVLLSLAVVSLGLSSCKMFPRPALSAGYYETTSQKKLCGHDIVREEVLIDAKSGLTEVRETKVPRYKTVTKKERVPCPKCTRYYWLSEGCCGSSTEEARKMATAQPSSGSPFIGLIPTMKEIAP
ncbi:hypothetical protein [Haloferula sp.]|uniref:hypothetical protein n=1 Tax=Haloferula sp. TaxID=2497595 RepID=UPI003C7811E2